MKGIKILLFVLFVWVIEAATHTRPNPSWSQVDTVADLLRNSKRTENGWKASIGTTANYTYFSAEWTVPPLPPVPGEYTLLYYKIAIEDASDAAIVSPVILLYDELNGAGPEWTLQSWYTPREGDYNVSARILLHPGDKIKGEIALSKNTWNISGYVNGTLRTQLQIPFAAGGYVQLPSKPGFVLATTSDLAAQAYLTVLPYNSTKTAGRLFTFSSDGYVSLTANPNLVLDVDGSTAKEGARVLVYAKKTPVATNQQWILKGRVLYSKLAASAFSLTVATDGKVILTNKTRDVLIADYQPDATRTAHLAQPGRASVVSEVYNVNFCDDYPPTNRLDFSNILLKKGTQTVLPSWIVGTQTAICQVRVSDITNTGVSLRWNSTLGAAE